MNEPAHQEQPSDILQSVFWKAALQAFEDVPEAERERWLQTAKNWEGAEHNFAEILQAFRIFWGESLNNYACLSEPERRRWQIEARRLGPAAQDFATTLEDLYRQKVQAGKESTPIERRNHVRANVGPEHTCRFQAGDCSFQDLPITKLSAGGCALKMPSHLAEGLSKGASLSLLYLIHPRIPSVPLEGTVTWITGKQPGKEDGFVLVGIEFCNPNPHFQETLDAYVRELLR